MDDKTIEEEDDAIIAGVEKQDVSGGSVESVEIKAKIIHQRKNQQYNKKKAKRTKQMKLQKAPSAPKRFKSAFIFFTMEKHPEVREQLVKDGVEFRTPDVAKIVSKQWQDLPASEREVWQEMARKDKKRFMREKSEYTGPWKVISSSSLSKFDPNAPKRPMSSFLSYSNGKRAALKAENPHFTNADLSKKLAQMWKEVPKEEKDMYIKREAALREKYKEDIVIWRENIGKQNKLTHAQEVPYACQQQGLSHQEMEKQNSRTLWEETCDHISSSQFAKTHYGHQKYEGQSSSNSYLLSSSMTLHNNNTSQIWNNKQSGNNSLYIPTGHQPLVLEHDPTNDFSNSRIVSRRTRYPGENPIYFPSVHELRYHHDQYQHIKGSSLSVQDQRYKSLDLNREANPHN